MVKAVANSPPIYNRNVSYATNTAMMFTYESSYKHAMPSSKTDENIKNRSVRLFLTKKSSPRCPVLLKNNWRLRPYDMYVLTLLLKLHQLICMLRRREF